MSLTFSRFPWLFVLYSSVINVIICHTVLLQGSVPGNLCMVGSGVNIKGFFFSGSKTHENLRQRAGLLVFLSSMRAFREPAVFTSDHQFLPFPRRRE